MSAVAAIRTMPVLLIPGLAPAAETARLPLDPLGGGLVQMILGLALILTLIVGASWLLRRYTPLRGGEGMLRVVGGLALGTRERLVLVEVGGVRLLLGVAPGRIQTLHVFDAAAAGEDFAGMLTAVGKGQRHEE